MNLAGILGLQVVQHDLLSEAQGFKYIEKHNVFYIFSISNCVAILCCLSLHGAHLGPFGRSLGTRHLGVSMSSYGPSETLLEPSLCDVEPLLTSVWGILKHIGTSWPHFGVS